MADKKKLNVEMQAAVTIDPADIAIKTRGLNKKIEAQFKEAIKGLSVTAGGRFKVAPEVERMSASDFTKFKRAYKEETDRLYKEAEKIGQARIEAFDRYSSGQGKKPSAQSLRLQQAKELAAQARKSSLALIEADRAINAATRKRIATGEKLSKREETLAAKRYEATKNALRDLQQLGKLQKDQRVFDPATGDYAFLKGSNIKGLQRSIKILSDEANAYGKAVSQVNKTRIDAAAAAKAEKELARATEVASKARKEGIRNLRGYSKELRKLQSSVSVSPTGIQSQIARSEALAKKAAAQRYKVEDTLSKEGGNLEQKKLQDLIRLREKLNSLEAKAKANAEQLTKAYERRSVTDAQARNRAKEESKLNAKREAELRKIASLEERIQRARRTSVSDLRKNQAILRSISGLEAETAGQAKSYAGQAARVADQARKQYNHLKSLRDQVTSSGVSVDPKAMERLNKNLARSRILYKEAAAASAHYRKAAQELNVTLGQGSLLIRQFFRYALGYGALYQALGAVNALKQSVVELDNALYSIKAIADATDREMVKISGSIKRVALETKYTTKEVAQAAKVLSQAGVTASELPNTLEAVSKFAAGTETEIKTAADLVSTMRNVFTELDDLDIANQLTRAINISKLTGEDLRTILGISAQVSKQYNLTAQNYLAAVTTLRNAGLKASTTATGLRQGLNEIFSPDNKTVKALQQRYEEIGERLTSKEIRDKFFSFTGELNPLLAAVRELNRLGFTGPGKKSLARGFDIRAANALTALVNNIDQLEASQTKLASGNQVFKASETQMESLTATVDNLSAAFTVMAANISEGPIRSLQDFIEKTTETIKWITELDIKARSIGESGAGQIAGTAISGGIVGATALGTLLGGTPAKRAVGALAGAATGAYVGAKQLEDRAAGQESLVSPEYLNTLAGVLTVFSLFKGDSKLSKLFGNRAKSEQLAEAAEKSLGGVAYFMSLLTKESFAKIGAFLWKAAKSLTVIGAATTAAMFVIEALLDGEKSEQQKREAHLKRVKALRDKAEAARQKVEKIESASARFERPDVSDYTSAVTPAADTVGGELQRNADALQTYLQVFENVFGKKSAEGIRAIEEALIYYRDKGFSKGTAEYSKALRNLARVAGTGPISGELEKQVNFLANNIKQLRNSVSANVESLNKQIQQAYDNLDAGAATDIDKALIKVVEDGGEDVRLALNAAAGDVTDDTEALIDSLQSFYDRLAKANREVSGLAAAELEAQKSKVDAFLAEALLDLKSTDNVNALKIKANSLVNSIDAVGEEGVAYLDLLIEQTTTLQQRLELQAKRLERDSKTRKNAHGRRLKATATPEEAQQAAAAYGNVQVYLDFLQRKRQETVADTERANEREIKKVSAGLDELTRLTDEQLKRATGQDKALYNLAVELRNNEEARKALITPVDLGNGQTAPAPGFNVNNGLLSANSVIQELLNLVNRAIADKGKSPDEQVGKLAKSPYIQDPATYKELYELDRQIADAKKRNLFLLTQDNESNPLRSKRDILLSIKDKEIGVEKQHLAKLIKAYGTDPADDKHNVEIQQQRASIQKKLVEREKIAADYQAQREESVRKYQDQILASAKKRFDLESQRLQRELDNAIAVGDSDRARELAQKIADLKQELSDIEVTQLQLAEQDSELTALTIRYKEEILAQERRRAQVAAEVAALEKRHKDELKRAQGGAAGASQTAFLEASGSGKSVTQQLQEAQRNLKIDLKYNLQQLQLKGSALETAKSQGASEEEIAKLADELFALSEQTGALAGKLYLVNKQLDNDALSFENFRAAWQASTDDMANSLKSSVAVWYQQSPHTIQTFLESIGEGIRNGLYRVFNSFIDSAITQLVQSGMDSILSLFDKSYDKKMEVTANEVYVSTTSAPGERTKTGVLAGSKEVTTAAVDAGTGSGDSEGFDVNATPAAGTEENPVEKAAEKTEENTSAIDANTLITGVLSGDAKKLSGSILYSILSTKVSDVKKTTATASLIKALLSNTLAVEKNTVALATSGPGLVAKDGGILKAAGGGILKGAGTGTSDSLRGYVVGENGQKQRIHVSNGEAILTERAVDFLGEDFIFAVNKIKPGAFAQGGFPGKTTDTPAAKIAATVLNAPAPEVTTEAKIVNLLDESLLVDAMQSDNGEKVILNTIQRNADSISPFMKS